MGTLGPPSARRASQLSFPSPPSTPAGGGLGLPRLSDQVNLGKWSMLNRLEQRGGLPALAVGGLLLTRATAVSGDHFLTPQQGDFIGLYTPTPVWGSSLGALGPDTALHLAPTLGHPVHPLLRPLTSALPLLDDFKLLRSLRLLDLSTWADLTARTPDGTRTWLNLPTLLPDLPPPLVPSDSKSMAGRPGVVATRTILAPHQGAGGLGLGWYPPSHGLFFFFFDEIDSG